jgi:hypothetical protein
MPMVCPRCGQQNADDAQFCVNRQCGEFLSWDDAVRQGQPRQPESVLDVPQQTVGGYLTLDPATLTAAPGETARSTVTVYNNGSQVEEFTVSATGAAAAWVTFSPAVLQVYPGASVTCAVMFAPPLRERADAGRTPLAVRAVSTLHPDLTVGADGAAEVETFHQLTATLTPLQSSGRGVTQHNIELVNAGNSTETVRIRATDPTAKMRFGVPPDEVSVPPGSQYVPVSVWPPKHRFGRRRWLPFQLIITPATDTPPLRLDGTRESRPTFPRWLVILVLVLFVLCICGYGGALVLGTLNGN